MSLRPLLLVAPFVASSAAVPGQSVLVVTNTGPGAVQAAIDAAADGDTLLIQPGQYSPCVVANKALTLLGDPAGGATFEGLRVQDLASGKRLHLEGLNVARTPTEYNLPESVFLLQHCVGSVRLQSVTSVMPVGNSSPGLFVDGCPDVALVHCTLGGSSIRPGHVVSFSAGWPDLGLRCRQSTVALHHCSVAGGHGRDGFYWYVWPNVTIYSPVAGAVACSVEGNSALFAHGSSFLGGDGGDGTSGGCSTSGQPISGRNGADAGDGLVVDTGSSATTLACTLLPGAFGLGGAGGACGGLPGSPGAPGVPSSGAVATIADAGAELEAPTHVRAGQPVALTVTGTPGDLVLLANSAQTRWVFDPLYEGVFLFGPPARRVILGTMPASGTLSFSLATTPLPPGTLAVHRYLQLVVRHPSGQIELGSPAFVTILDPSF